MWWTNSLCTSANEDLGTLAEHDPPTHPQETLNVRIASGQVVSSGADIASLANGVCTGAVAVQVSPVSQVVSDTTAEVVAFNAYSDWCKEKAQNGGTGGACLVLAHLSVTL